MKARLTFNLDDPDDSMAHMRCIKSMKLVLVLWELLHNSKKGIYNQFDMMPEHERKKMDYIDGIERVYMRLRDLLDEHDINIDELIQ